LPPLFFKSLRTTVFLLCLLVAPFVRHKIYTLFNKESLLDCPTPDKDSLNVVSRERDFLTVSRSTK